MPLQRPRRFPPKIRFPWYYVTRGIGATFLIFGLLFDDSTDRGTIILTGAGLLGIDKVARSEPPK